MLMIQTDVILIIRKSKLIKMDKGVSARVNYCQSDMCRIQIRERACFLSARQRLQDVSTFPLTHKMCRGTVQICINSRLSNRSVDRVSNDRNSTCTNDCTLLLSHAYLVIRTTRNHGTNSHQSLCLCKASSRESGIETQEHL